MEAAFYREPFQAAGIAVVVPDRAERNPIDAKYFGEVVRGIVWPETRQRLVEIAAAMKERDGIEGLNLGGTELPLLLKEERAAGLDLLDTTALHVAEIVHPMLA